MSPPRLTLLGAFLSPPPSIPRPGLFPPKDPRARPGRHVSRLFEPPSAEVDRSDGCRITPFEPPLITSVPSWLVQAQLQARRGRPGGPSRRSTLTSQRIGSPPYGSGRAS